MSAPTTHLSVRRSELVIRPLGEKGQYVVKDPRTGEYFHLGEEEHFLLRQLDVERDAAEVCTAFEERFGQPLSDEDLQEFLELAQEQGLLEELATPALSPPNGRRERALTPDPSSRKAGAQKPAQQSLLYWRKSVFDPDRFFTWLEPKIRFFWTRGFLVVSAGCIAMATMILWTGRSEAATSFSNALRWETVLFVWLVMLLVGTLHEFAHGLTCKHYGGEVREIGFLLMYFMPCFYCNVSDAWLFREKSKRLWVTFAGGYFELFLWALAVFVWRLTMPDSLVNYLAFIVLASCGIESFFNFNPLLKLDGYYLLSDLVEVPNLRQRALERLKGQLRWLLWGAARPAPPLNRPLAKGGTKGGFLLSFGIASWMYSLTFLVLMLAAMGHFLGARWGAVGLGAVAVLGLFTTRGLFQGLSNGEVRKMIRLRHKRTAGWVAALGSAMGAMWGLEMEDRASAPFQVRSVTRTELRAPTAGFLQEVYFDQGDRLSAGAIVARLEIPDLASRIAQKRAELRETEAQLRLLEIGPRSEEILAQRQRVNRAEAWRDLARQDLERMRKALQEELVRLDAQVAQYRAELEAAEATDHRARSLSASRAASAQETQEVRRRLHVVQAQLEQAEAENRARRATGTLQTEEELARREKELADAQATLTLLEAGSRAEEIEAQRAKLARLREEAQYLEHVQQKLVVATPLPGLITTPRLKEKVGSYLGEGELICVVEEPSGLEVEIALTEQEVARVGPSQSVALKCRSLPFEIFHAQVDRIAPAAEPGEVQSSVTVYCRIQEPEAALRPGMTGHARIYTGRRPIGELLVDRVMRFVRTEFWW